MTRTFLYVRFADLPRALAAGWLPDPAFVGTHHGEYSVLCEWLCACGWTWPAASEVTA